MIRVNVRRKPDRAQYQLYYTDPYTGRDRTKSAGTTDRKEAERAAALWEQELSATSPSGDGRVTWEAFRRRFEDEYLPHCKRLTQRSYVTCLNAFEKHFGTPKLLASIDETAISIFTGNMLQAKLKRHTIAKNLRGMRVAFNWAFSMRMLPRKIKVHVLSVKGHGTMKGRPITDAEFGKMVSAANKVRPGDKELVHALWLLKLSGLRLRELESLSFDSPPVQLKMNTECPVIVFHGSGQKSGENQVVPLTPDCVQYIKRHITHRTGKVIRAVTRLERHISACGELAGIVVNKEGKFASAHDLRRTFGTVWASRVMPAVLKEMMRHDNIETTMAYYVNQQAQDLAKIIQAAYVPPSVPETGSGKAGQKKRTPKKQGKKRGWQ